MKKECQLIFFQNDHFYMFKKNLRKQSPRLVLNSTIEKNLKKKLKTDPIVNFFYQIQLLKLHTYE